MTENLFNTLEDLRDNEFSDFRWYLQQPDIVEPYHTIKVSKLERAERRDTVDLMVNAYKPHGALMVTKKVLEKIYRNDLVQRLSDTSSGPEVDASNAVEAPENRELSSSHSEDEIVPVPEPRPISYYKQKFQSNLQDKFMCAQEGWMQKKDEQHLDDIYTELYITAGGDIHINTQHEVRQIESRGNPADNETPIKPSDMFKPPTEKYKPIRTVLTNGIAGIGKTFLVHKFVLDWSEGRANQDVHLIFPFTFRQLNLWKGKKLCLTKLIHKCVRESRDIKEEALNHIFTSLQSSGNTNYDKSQFKLLFILDGLDESQLDLDCSTDENQAVSFDATKSTSVDELMTNLINRNLLPSARLWITTRPAAANQIPPECVDVATEVRGFTDQQKEEYFRKRFSDAKQVRRIISHIKASRSLHIMCHIPVFCWITTTVLKDMLKTSKEVELPRTLTEMYTEFLVFQIHQTKEKYNQKKCIRYIKSLAKLAFHQLEKGNLIFYEKDLKQSGIDVSGASMCSGVFTEIFKEERGRKNDEDKIFSFVHLTVQEFLAALYVKMTFINRNKNVMSAPGQSCGKRLKMFFKTSEAEVHRFAIEKALQSPNGHLDLFLRFLLGLSLQNNQDLRNYLLKQKSSPERNHETVKYIKERISGRLSPERSINLFHCLNELNDRSLVEEIQKYLSSGGLSTDKLSPAQWSALVFILLSSETDLEVFDLKEYFPSEQALLRLLPVVKASNKALLSSCNLSERCCIALTSVVSSWSSSLRELDLSNNDLQDSGVKLLAAGLGSPQCRLEVLRLSGCNLSDRGCKALSLVLSCQSSSLRELDLSNNDLQDSKVKLLPARLQSSQWRLDTLSLYDRPNQSSLTERSRRVLSLVLSSNSSSLKELDMMEDSGVHLLCAGLESPYCTLETLRLSGCLITEEHCTSLASALRSNPSHLRELDLSYNNPGGSGLELLSAGLEDPHWRLETLRLDHGGEQWMKPGLKKYACELTVDTNTVNTKLQLSHNNRKVTSVAEEQPYPHHPDRFKNWPQLLCQNGLTGRCYWEVEWRGRVHVSLSYRGIRRGCGPDCRFGGNDQSWSLFCSNFDGYSVCYNNKRTDLPFSPPPSPSSNRVAVYVDCPAGSLSFYSVSSDKLIHLHTFSTTFTEPLYPGFGFWFGFDSSVCL